MGSAAKVSRVNSVTQIKVTFIDEKLVLAALTSLGVPHEADVDTAEQLAVTLWSHFTTTVNKEDQMACWQCNGISDANLDLCPYCGAGDAPEESAAQAEKKEDAPKNTASVDTAAPAAEKKEANVTTAAAAKKTTKKSTSKKNGAANLAVVPATHKAVVVDDTRTSSNTHTVRELDAAVSQVQKLKGDGAVAMWTLGMAMRNIYDNQLWKLRSDPTTGKPMYKSVDAFCNSELGMTPQNAYKLMDISKNYSEDKVRTFGTAKLGLLLEAPPEDQKRILEKMEADKKAGKNTPFRQVEAEVRQVNKKKKKAPRESRGKKMPTGGGRKKESKQITVASILGSNTVKLYTKATFKSEPGDQKRAKKFAELPWGRMELENGVVMFMALQENAAGEWQIRVETKREAAAE